jgi:hypothetical protein
VWNQLPAAKKAELSAALAKSIRERHESAKAPISIRLVPEQIAAAKNRCEEVRRLPDPIADVDSRGDPPRSEADLMQGAAALLHSDTFFVG